MSSMFRRETEWSGNTYPIRAQIRSLGGTWDAARKVWIVPAGTMRQRGEMDRLSRTGGVRVDPVGTAQPTDEAPVRRETTAEAWADCDLL